MKNQNDFLNWFQEWCLFFSVIKDIFCTQILEGYKYFIEHGSNLIPTSCSQVLFFLSGFQIPWIVCWDFILTQIILTPFPAHLAREFKVKWWSNFSFYYSINSLYHKLNFFKKMLLQSSFFRNLLFKSILITSCYQDPHFLQIKNTKSVSKCFNKKLQKHCHYFLIRMMTLHLLPF